MLKTETLENGRIRHYSDTNMHIRQIESGALYEDAVDGGDWTYEETDIPIEGDSYNPEELLNIIVGEEAEA